MYLIILNYIKFLCFGMCIQGVDNYSFVLFLGKACVLKHGPLSRLLCASQVFVQNGDQSLPVSMSFKKNSAKWYYIMVVNQTIKRCTFVDSLKNCMPVVRYVLFLFIFITINTKRQLLQSGKNKLEEKIPINPSLETLDASIFMGKYLCQGTFLI